MRVFITGGTGTIGEAVTKELRRAGHAVRGLSRSEASDAKLDVLPLLLNVDGSRCVRTDD
jgi:nucleoside-diphosphate-sugar epimerase